MGATKYTSFGVGVSEVLPCKKKAGGVAGKVLAILKGDTKVLGYF